MAPSNRKFALALACTALLSGYLALGPFAARPTHHAVPSRTTIASGKAPPESDFFGGEFDDDDDTEASDPSEDVSDRSDGLQQQLRGGRPTAPGYFHDAPVIIVAAIVVAYGVSCLLLRAMCVMVVARGLYNATLCYHGAAKAQAAGKKGDDTRYTLFKDVTRAASLITTAAVVFGALTLWPRFQRAVL